MRVVGRQNQCDDPVLLDEGVLIAERSPFVDDTFDGCHGQGRVASDAGGQFQGSARFCEVVDQAESLGVLGGQRLERMGWTAFADLRPGLHRARRGALPLEQRVRGRTACTPRDPEAERAALRSAADRLLAGTPLRSESGRLTATELLRESGLRRDVAYGDHKDLVEEFQARVKAQNATPAAMQELADKHSEVRRKLAAVTENLTKEQAVSAALRRIVAELDLEVMQAREELQQSGNVARLPAPRRGAART